MNLLCIDLGGYSIKFIEAKLDRRSTKLIRYFEEIVTHYDFESAEVTPIELKLNIIQEILADSVYDGKVIMTLPAPYLVSRYITIPIPNKSKARKMIPFQLDEALPFSMMEAHHTSILNKQEGSIFAQVGVVKKHIFNDFYQKLSEKDIMPNLLVSEMSLAQSYISTTQLTDPIAIFDLGHDTTKAYFIDQGRVVANHFSHIGGRAIDQILARTYETSIEEAVQFKHENSFFLTEGQYSKVSDDQRSFALLMKQSVTPLVQELKRWELGFRVDKGYPVKTIYITGGTSKIKNIDNFLSQALGIPVEHWNPPHSFQCDEKFEGQEPNFFSSILMSQSQLSPTLPPNFLHGEFTGRAGQNLPLHSTSFILTRTAIFAMIIALILMVEKNFVLKKELTLVNRQVLKLLKRPELGIKNTERKRFTKKPKPVINKLKKQNLRAEKDIETLKDSLNIDAISPLAQLSSRVGKLSMVELNEFESNQREAIARFRVPSADNIKKVERIFNSLDLPGQKVNIDTKSKTIKISFENEASK